MLVAVFRNWRAWLNEAFGAFRAKRETPHRRNPIRRFRPACFPLEDRLAPATFTPTTFSDVAISSPDVVNSAGQITDQGNAITLRSAVIAANALGGANTKSLALAAGTYAAHRSLSNNFPRARMRTVADRHQRGPRCVSDFSNLTIQGAGQAATIIKQTTANDRVFNVNENFSPTFSTSP